MTLTELSITFCCQNLQMALIRNEYCFQIDSETETTILVDNEERWSGTCPFCHRKIEDVVEVKVKEK